MPLELSITNEEKVLITVNPVTSTGRPAQLDGEVIWDVISGDATFDPQSPTTAYIISSDNAGDTMFRVEADADLGEGVVTIQDTILLHTVGALAASLGLAAGTPEPK